MLRSTAITKELAVIERKLRETTNETLKNALKKKQARLKDELKDASKSAPQLAKTLLAQREEIKALPKSDFNDLIRRLSKKPEYSFLKTMGKSTIRTDIERPAKPVGWRFKGRGNYEIPSKAQIAKGKRSGTVYREVRPLRSDVSRIVRLEEGGVVGQEIVIDYQGDEYKGVIAQITDDGDYIVDTDNGRTVLAQKEMDVISLGAMKKKSMPTERKKRFGLFEDGGKMAFGCLIDENNVSIGGILRMEGLSPNETLDEFINNAKYIVSSLEDEGFEKDEIYTFLAHMMVQNTGSKMKTGDGVDDCTASYEMFVEFVESSNNEYIQDANIIPYLEMNGVVVSYKQSSKKVAVIVYNPRKEKLSIPSVISSVMTMFPKEVQANIDNFSSKYSLKNKNLCSATLIKIVNHNGELIEEFEEFERGGGVDSMSTVNEIARLSGLRAVAVAEYGDKNNINLSAILKDLKSKKIKGADLMTAIVGKQGNKYSNEMIIKYTKM